MALGLAQHVEVPVDKEDVHKGKSRRAQRIGRFAVERVVVISLGRP